MHLSISSSPEVDSSSTSTNSEATSTKQPPRRAPRGRVWKNGVNWTRIAHVYLSMAALLVVLFFAVTGITLNHPDWTFGMDSVDADYAGTLPDGWVAENGTIQFLTVSEYLRDTFGVDGDVVDFGSDITDGFISYREPGYSADVFFDLASGEFRLNVEQQGLLSVLNELHRGRDSGSSWSWLIDASGAFLVAIAVTGIGLQVFLAKRRRAAMLTALGGTLLTVAFIAWAVI